jgi:transcriptional regulator with XRE-family HTH domain
MWCRGTFYPMAIKCAMPKKLQPLKRQLRRTFLREWRLYRGLTQEQAAERIGLDHSTLGRIERRLVPYSQGMLEAAAEAYSCEPWDLLNVDPTKAGEVVDLTRILKDRDPKVIAEIIGYAKGRISNN